MTQPDLSQPDPAAPDPARVAWVTGASRGIGRAVVRALAADGCSVAATARSGAALEQLAGECVAAGVPGRVLPVVADVTGRSAVEHAARRVADVLGPVDLLVANAGTLDAYGPTWEVDPDTWWSDVEVSLRGVHLATWSVLAGMVERGRGRVVAVTSGVGNRPARGISAYGAAKAAVTQLIGSLDEELTGTGVQVFAVSPGMVRTDLTRFPDALLAAAPRLAAAVAADAWTPVDRVVGLVRGIAAGRHDALAGRFVHATDDPDVLARSLAAAGPGARQLRLRGYGPDDPAAG